MRKLSQSLRLKKRCLAPQGFYILAIILSFSSSLMAQQLRRIDGTTISTDSLNHYLPKLMEKAGVTGLGLTIFNQNKVVYKNTFGYADGVKKTALRSTANFYGASLSKCIFTMIVMKLVEQGKLDLDKPLQQYLPKPIYEYKKQTRWHDDYSSLKNDPLYQKITARMCLDHTTGFPNWRWDVADRKLKVLQEPGTRYSYSGEGMVYLQVVLEKMTTKSLEQLADEVVFGPLNMKNSAYTFLPAFEKDYILGHDTKGKPYEKDKDNEARSPSTLETTFDDMTLFVEGLMQKKVINSRTTNEIFTPQIAIRSVEQMGPLSQKDTSANDNISLSYGLGFGLLKSPYGWGVFKEGHGDGFQHYMILFPKQKIGVLIMTNSDNGESIFKELLALSIADEYTPWKWQRYFPYDSGMAKEQ